MKLLLRALFMIVLAAPAPVFVIILPLVSLVSAASGQTLELPFYNEDLGVPGATSWAPWGRSSGADCRQMYLDEKALSYLSDLGDCGDSAAAAQCRYLFRNGMYYLADSLRNQYAARWDSSHAKDRIDAIRWCAYQKMQKAPDPHNFQSWNFHLSTLADDMVVYRDWCISGTSYRDVLRWSAAWRSFVARHPKDAKKAVCEQYKRCLHPEHYGYSEKPEHAKYFKN